MIPFCTRVFTALIFLFGSLTLSAAPLTTLDGDLTLTARSDFPDTVEAWDFIYSEEGEEQVHGVLLKPTGDGPFPAIVLAHGKGGDAKGFAREKGVDWFAASGYASISPELTHAGGVYCTDESNHCGGDPVNVRRLMDALDVLTSTQLADEIGAFVDTDRLLTYGNSLGALTVIESIERSAFSDRLVAAAISAGGVVRRSGGELMYMTPSGLDGVKRIELPLLQLHGRGDDVIYAREAATVTDTLVSGRNRHQMVWYPEHGHNIARGMLTSPSVEQFIGEWFAEYLNGTGPVVLSMAPDVVITGDPITIVGTGFGDEPGYLTLGKTRLNPLFWSDTQIEFNLPANAESGELIVTAPVGPVDDEYIEQPVTGGVQSDPVFLQVDEIIN